MYQQTTLWMGAVCSTEHGRKSSNKELEEIFAEAGIPKKDIDEFFKQRARSFVESGYAGEHSRTEPSERPITSKTTIPTRPERAWGKGYV
jgi:hypothetical protein